MLMTGDEALVKHPILFGVSILLLVGGILFFGSRMVFLWTAAEVVGQVSRIEARDVSCVEKGRGIQRDFHCTQFTAYVRYRVEGVSYETNIDAGETDLRNAPISYATQKPGDSVPLLYDRLSPQSTLVNSPWGIWSSPVVILVAHFLTLLLSITVPRDQWGRRKQSFHQEF